MTTWTPSSTPAVGDKIPVAFANAFGAGTAYTPTIGGSGWAVGNGTLSGQYAQVQKLVLFQCKFVIGSSTTKGTALTLSLPVQAANTYNPVPVDCLLACAGNSYRGFAYIPPGGTVANIYTQGTLGVAADLTSTNPATWTTGNYINFGGWYWAA